MMVNLYHDFYMHTSLLVCEVPDFSCGTMKSVLQFSSYSAILCFLVEVMA